MSAIFLAFGLIAGCGGDKPLTEPKVTVHQAKGKATFGGKPIAGLMVEMIPETQQQSLPCLVGGTTGADGSFTLQTQVPGYKVIEGAPEGEYKVCFRSPWDPDALIKPVDADPALETFNERHRDYTSKGTPLRATIKAGNNDLSFAVP